MSNQRIKPTIISHDGVEVECYGTWEEDSNCMVVCEDERFDGPFIGDGQRNWREVVKHLSAYAKRNRTKLVELVAC